MENNRLRPCGISTKITGKHITAYCSLHKFLYTLNDIRCDSQNKCGTTQVHVAKVFIDKELIIDT